MFRFTSKMKRIMTYGVFLNFHTILVSNTIWLYVLTSISCSFPACLSLKLTKRPRIGEHYRKKTQNFLLSQNLCRLKMLSFMQLKSKEPESKTLAKYNSVHIYEKDMASILIFLQERSSNHFSHLLMRINNKTVPGI